MEKCITNDMGTHVLFQFEAERLATIERDNRILLEKMAHIMRKGGAVDNKKEDYHVKRLRILV